MSASIASRTGRPGQGGNAAAMAGCVIRLADRRAGATRGPADIQQPDDGAPALWEARVDAFAPSRRPRFPR